MKVKRCFLEWSLVSRRFAVALTFVLGGGMLLAANLVPLKGVVKDASGEPMAGVTVRIKDGKSGTITDVNGHFVLDVEKGKKLLLSYIGYSETEVLVKDDQQMQIVLKEDAQQLQEVVVVGYGTAKKVNLVGAVDQIDSKQIAERGNSNISRSLQGMVPGLNITFSDGKPSRTPSINLRGTGSIGAGGSALVLINGVEGDLNSVNPADVESVSVLKDASSAAIYGARGAFGVILVTTKNATAGKTKINYNGSFSMHQRTVKTEDGIVSNGLQWTDGWYTAYLEGQEAPPGGINNVFKYSTDWYNELVRRDADPSLDKVRVNDKGEYEYFGNTNWLDIIYKDQNYSTEHNVSISGGNERARYYVSGRYYNQDGIYNAGDEKYTQYNIRSKGEIQINKSLLLENNTDVMIFRSHQPMVMYDRQNITRQAQHQGYPVTMEKNPDGTWTEAAVYIGWAGFVEGTSWQKDNKLDVRNTTTLTYTPIKQQLIFKGDFTYYSSKSTRLRAENQYNYYTGPEIMGTRNTFSSLENMDYNKEYLSSNITGNYIPKFSNSNHYLNVLLGWNLEHQDYKTIQTYRRGLISATKPSFALMDGDYYTTGQGGNEWAYVGFLYRLNYNYKSRYLAEVSGRYDASSKFPENQQWGFFPSGSLGWRISEEPFMKSTRNWLDNLKVRASVGSLGNGNVSPYLYLSTIPIKKTSVILGDALQTYATTPNIVPNSLTWEKSTTYDIGLDVDMLSNRLSMVFDYYQRYTTDMYTVGPTLPAVLGAATPKGNNAEMKTKGWELSVMWRDNFTLANKPFNYSVKAMLWDSRTWVTKFNNPTKLLSTYYEGQEIGTIWGYHIEGLFKDQAEIDAHADQSKLKVSATNILKPGDLKFADLDKSGTVDNGQNTLDDHGDLKVIGNTTPRYQFGLNLSANWNGIGISAFFQGVGKRNWYPHRESAFFWGQYDRPYSYMLKEHTGNNVWTEENQNTDAYWPRYRGYLANGSTKALGIQANNRYLQNIAYVRLKNLQIDYTFNKKFCDKLHLQDLKIYLAGENLLTWTPLNKHTKMYDPEGISAGDADFRSTADTDGDGYGYPILSSYTIGINVTFNTEDEYEKYWLIGLYALALTSCDSFLNCEPENSFSSEGFLESESDLRLYTNGFLQSFLPGEETIAWGGDQYADFCATRSSTTFLIGDTWDDTQQGGWGTGDWGDLRQINYFLDNLPNAKGKVTDAIYLHNEGVGRFWRAYFYYGMVRTFGDVPWYETTLDVDNRDELYKPRDKREVVMDKILEDLDFACTNCSTDKTLTESSTLITKWVALALKSRICLFEGTYRKYHTELGLQSSAEKFLRASITASEELMTKGPYKLLNTGDVETQYRSLFTSEELNTTEVIWGIAFKKDLRMHSITWKLFSASFGANWSLVRPFVNMYLMRDGNRFTDRTDYATMQYMDEFQNRDCRLMQTVISPSYQRKISGTVKPDAPNFSMTSTGYQLIKWAIDDDVHVGKATANNSIPIFRYAEVLLNYAEAKAELGECDETVWNATVKPLRERAGVEGKIPATYDPYVAAYFKNQTTDKWVLEVRRERGVELAFEGVRYDDIMRWKQGDLIETIWQGIYIPQKGEAYDLNGDGAKDVAVVDKEPPAGEKIKGVQYVVIGKTNRLSEGDHGYIEFGFSQGRKWDDKKYLRPIPLTATQINPALLPQNPGW